MIISENLKDQQAMYNDGATIPANTNTDGTALPTGKTNSQLEIVIEAKTLISIADTKILTVTISDSATEGGSYVAFKTDAQTASGATTYAVNQVISRVTLPLDVKEWTNVNVATDDAGATGTYDAYVRRIVK